MKKRITLGILLIIILVRSLPHILHTNEGVSTSIGSPRDGSLKNGYLLDYSLKNMEYFSLLSYYVMGNAYLNSKLYHTLMDTYKTCENTCPDKKFRVMECSSSKGGKLLIHWTHRNGLSTDFMVPKVKDGKQVQFWDGLGFLHYLLEFDEIGRLKLHKAVSIDFETMGRHILALDDAARKNGLEISKIIFKINLKDDLYRTAAGKEIQQRSIYMVQSLQPKVDMLHDDHYHVDFVVR